MVGSYEHPLAYAILQVNTANPARTLISISINADFHKSQFNSIFFNVLFLKFVHISIIYIAVKSLAIHTLAQCPKFSRADNQHTDHQKKVHSKRVWKRMEKNAEINLNKFEYFPFHLWIFNLLLASLFSMHFL